MNVAVISLTRDRLDYTKHCFRKLRENAGIDYGHFVYDNASKDGTPEWLESEYDCVGYVAGAENVGIARALNYLLGVVEEEGGYDVIVNVDNDCEVTVPGTLRVVAEIAANNPGSLVGPRVDGLRRPPVISCYIDVDGHRVGVTTQIGGIFMPLPPGWRYPETSNDYGNCDVLISSQAVKQGHIVGQLIDYPVNHYETTNGQEARYPEYFARRRAEGVPD